MIALLSNVFHSSKNDYVQAARSPFRSAKTRLGVFGLKFSAIRQRCCILSYYL